MKIGIIGLGFVGKAHYDFFKSKNIEVYGYDIDTEKNIDSKEQVLDCDYIYVCLPTPMGEDGKCNLNYIYNFFNGIISDKIFILKSTVTPGTTQDIANKYNVKICHNPEFLRADYALQDIKNEKRLVFGLTSTVTRQDFNFLRQNCFNKHLVSFCLSGESELFKYFANVFLACKVLLMNSFFFTANKYSIDYNQVKNLMKSDPRLGCSHFDVPGSNGEFGFGGYCFPKDTNSFKNIVDQDFVELYSVILKTNQLLRERK